MGIAESPNTVMILDMCRNCPLVPTEKINATIPKDMICPDIGIEWYNFPTIEADTFDRKAKRFSNLLEFLVFMGSHFLLFTVQ
jgi:hypothetical protein